MQSLPADFSAGRQVLLYKSNYLDSLIAACGTIQRAIRTNYRTVLNCTPLTSGVFCLKSSVKFAPVKLNTDGEFFSG